MLFCDVKGSTAAAERLDPEEWTEIMNGAYDHMIRPVHRYDGTVGRLMGDAVLAFFGAPTAHEDDPQRAVLAGLDIVDGIQGYRRQVSERWGVEFDVRVGINTGLVVAGAVGSDQHMEYSALGDAINLAARMEQTAEPGTVQVSEDTYRLVAPLFDFKPLGGIQVKGKSEPVPAYQVLDRKAAPGRLRGISGLESPVVGRKQETALLEQALADLSRGVGGLLFLTGEAGLGKSRLISELQRSASNLESPPSWYETASLSYETDQPYALFKRLIRRMIGSNADEAPDALREKIGRFAEELLEEDRVQVRLVFESVFGLVGAEGKPPLEGEAFKGHLYTVMSSLWRLRAMKRPLVLVSDDLHWSDGASAALLDHLLPLAEEVPLLLIGALRPDRQAPGWQVKQRAESDFAHCYTEISLLPLNAENSNRLVDTLLSMSALPLPLRRRILEKSEGNPFFVEEIVRELIDGGALVRDEERREWVSADEGAAIQIPDNVQALLMARIDRLELAARRTLQVASVVGRSFYRRVLARVLESDGELDRQLLALQRTELIREKSRLPEREYMFRHALTQMAAYSSILRRERREFHRRVGQALEAMFPRQSEELSGALAHHFHESEEYGPALRYYSLAGDAAMRLFALSEAIEAYGRALECAGRVEATGEQLIHLYTRRGRAYELDNQFEKALESYREMNRLAGERGDETLRLASLAAECILRATQTPLYDPPRARQLAHEALALAQRLGDRAAEAKLLWGLLLVEQWGGGAPEKALEYGQRSLAIARELNHREQMGYTLSNLMVAYWGVDRLDSALAASLEAQAIWEELGNTPMLADAYNLGLFVHYYRGEFDAALATAEKARVAARSVGNIWSHAGALGSASLPYLEKGQVGQALEMVERAAQMGEEAGIPAIIQFVGRMWLVAYLTARALDQAGRYADRLYGMRDSMVASYIVDSLAAIAQVRIAQGQLDQAQQVIQEAYREVDVNRSSALGIGWLLTADAQLQLALGKAERALEKMAYLSPRIRQAGIRVYLPAVLWLQAKALLALERPEEAASLLLEAKSVAEETGARRVLWPILATLAEVKAAQGRTSEALALRGQARSVIEVLADHMGSSELRHTFMAGPDVQALLRTTETLGG